MGPWLIEADLVSDGIWDVRLDELPWNSEKAAVDHLAAVHLLFSLTTDLMPSNVPLSTGHVVCDT